MRGRALVVALAHLALPGLAAAQGLAVDVAAGYQDLTQAKSSAKAVFDGKSGGVLFGGGLRYGLGEHVFIAGWGRYFSKDGERVFVASASGPVFRLGHPLKVRIVPVQATLGYRIGKGSLVPYLGAGGGITSYHEESSVGGLVTSTSQTKASGHILAGVEYGSGSLRFAAESAYTLVPSAIGLGGVSKVYGETDIGGLSLVGKLVLAFGGK